MGWFITNLLIACVLLAWIASVYGYGGLALHYFTRYVKGGDIFKSILPLKLLASALLGVFFLSFIVQILNFFLPISSFISIALLVCGIGLFIYFYRIYWRDVWLIASAAFAFCMVAPLSMISDSVGDSVNYHIQIVTWIQQSPVIFGLANIHSRLGFNGLIYNFYALSDVSQIIPHLRAFIGNEIVYFGLAFSGIYIFLKREFTHFYYVFLGCCLFALPFLMMWGEFQGLYCEGIGAVMGICVFSLLFAGFERKNSAIFILCFFISLFAIMVKIANAALIVSVICCFIVLFRAYIFTKSFIKTYVIIGICALILVLPWAIKGIMTTGMIASPAPIGFIQSLPWAMSESVRQSDVCWIMSWARAPGKDCREVLADSMWLIDWLKMKPHYFGYFKHFCYALCVSLIIFALVRFCRIYGAKVYINANSALDSMPRFGFVSVFCSICIGIIFWFLTGPDPRFGMVYIVPLLGFFFAYNVCAIKGFDDGFVKYALYLLFLISVICLFKSERAAFVLVWAVLLLLPKGINYRIYVSLAIISQLLAIPNLYRNQYVAIKEIPKVRPIFIEEQFTDYGVKIYVRRDNPTDKTTPYDYEPRPSGPYLMKNVKESSIGGRKAYIIK
ncbi:hypothetical protein LS71_001650 [Helicobacter jaachi]|uniref:DUF8201 domain-containing protein n=1 Tax=Helicobacter jaachi TaxID=1677920 RepID=A0A4U8TC22_9HELI|nr:hypothetical protein [Helicobacter jaachi]TLD97481.1 hypothetical protein LS71_001650 [Helicobacter jaachi]